MHKCFEIASQSKDLPSQSYGQEIQPATNHTGLYVSSIITVINTSFRQLLTELVLLQAS